MTAIRMFVLGMLAAVALYFLAVYWLVNTAVRIVEKAILGHKRDAAATLLRTIADRMEKDKA